MARSKTSFAAGKSGNPAGRPRVAEEGSRTIIPLYLPVSDVMAIRRNGAASWVRHVADQMPMPPMQSATSPEKKMQYNVTVSKLQAAKIRAYPHLLEQRIGVLHEQAKRTGKVPARSDD